MRFGANRRNSADECGGPLLNYLLAKIGCPNCRSKYYFKMKNAPILMEIPKISPFLEKLS
jgi:DNA-directed RNA polymerase subunit RPC12/RpoP